MANGLITIGCSTSSIEHWIENYVEMGQGHGYSEEEIKSYGKWIKLMAQV